jgi:gamma-glutamylcyclotransferase (GGCT)/AIG2-like uncharacterized protein YtfP
MTDTQTHPAPDDTQELPFFVYGTLRPRYGNDRMWHGNAWVTDDGRATLADHRLVVGSSPFPFCVPTFEPSDIVYGSLIHPMGEGARYRSLRERFDMLEGHPGWYHRTKRTIGVIRDGEPAEIEAWVYVMHGSATAALRPVIGNDWANEREAR